MSQTRMPALFLGHGTPMNTLDNNHSTQTWARVGREYPRPRAILCISAHWFTRGTGGVQASARDAHTQTPATQATLADSAAPAGPA